MPESTNQSQSQSQSQPLEESDAFAEEQQESGSGEQSQSKLEQASDISQLLQEALTGEKPSEGGDESEGERDEGESKKPSGRKPKTFDQLAKQMGVDVKELYDMLVYMGPDNEPISVGALKDVYREKKENELQSIQWNEERIKQQREIQIAKEEVQLLMSAIPEDKLKKDQLQAVRGQIAARAKTEREQLLRKVPQWSDETVRDSELKEIGEHLQQYGFDSQYAKNISDHRLLVYIREQQQREKRLRNALEKAQAARKTSPGAGRGNGKPSRRPKQQQEGGAPAQQRSRQASQVSQLLLDELKSN